VRSTEARVAVLRHELSRTSGADSGQSDDESHPYPNLRQLPSLAVPWANLYRQVRIQETLYEMLSAQYETARIEEAKSIPTVSVIDPPGLPEKKSSPHRAIIVLVSTALAFVLASLFLLAQRAWMSMDDADGRKVLGREIADSLAALPARFRKGAR
jgi:capsule polysaccharide export protein KpsE/RkpR